MPVPNWGPMAGQDVQNADEYARQYPPPEGGAFTSASVGAGGVHEGAAITDPAAVESATKFIQFEGPVRNWLQQQSPWDAYFAQGAAAPGMQMPGFNTANQDQARAAQMRAIQDLQAQAAGSLGTQAQQQLAQGYGQAGAQQSSLGSTFRGQNAGAAMRGIQSGQQGVQRGFAGDQQMLKLQEQQAAQAMLAQLLAQQQGQDINQANAMAQGQLQGDAMNQDMRQFYLGGAAQQGIGNYQYGADYLRSMYGLDLASRDLDTENRNRLIGAGAGAVGAATNIYRNSGNDLSGRYRQVDGQDSIVPIEDK